MVMKEQSYTSTPPMGRTACTKPQCLYKGALYLYFTPSFLQNLSSESDIVAPLSNSNIFFFSLRPSNICLSYFPRLLSSSIFPSVTRFRRQFLPKMWKIKLSFLVLTVCCVLLSFFTVGNNTSSCTQSVQLAFSVLPRITFQNFQDIFYLLSEVSTFQQRAQPCSKYSNSPECTLNLRPTYDMIFINCNWVVTRWQYTFTHKQYIE
jgi:uncharacterized protein YggT (Ycf19 family)